MPNCQEVPKGQAPVALVEGVMEKMKNLCGSISFIFGANSQVKNVQAFCCLIIMVR